MVVPAYPGRVVLRIKLTTKLVLQLFNIILTMVKHCIASVSQNRLYNFWKILWLENFRHGIFGGLIFGPGIFSVFLEALGILLGFNFCPHSITRT